jgi:predicted secreted protein
VQHAAQAREAFERPQLEKFVEQHRHRLAAAVLGAAEERQRGVERGAGPGRRRLADRERRTGDHRPQETFGRRGCPLDVEIQRPRSPETFAQLVEDRGPSAPTSAEEHWNARRRGVERRHHATYQVGARSHHAKE